jgi:hypothetical protein
MHGDWRPPRAAEDREAPLNFPDARRDRLHDRNAEGLLACAPVRPGAQQ